MQTNFKVENYELDNNQMKLLMNNSNALVIAGAGSGKTLTILGKVNYLVEHKKLNPQNIALISFTNASVNDIKKRISHNVNVFTFHKLAMYILEKADFNYKICNAQYLSYIINEYLQTCPNHEQKTILNYTKYTMSYKKFLKSKQFNFFCNLIESFINFYKTNSLNSQTILSIKYSKLEKKILIIIFKIYQIYLTEKASTQQLDFDDLITTATLIVDKVKLNFEYIIVDEFQDTSLIRLNLIKKINSIEHSKIVVVGDDWQSIYRFSGCDLNIFLNFSSYFNNVIDVKLLNTYRNSQELIDIAARFVKKNPEQIQKELISQKHNKTPIILVPYKERSSALKKVLDYLLEKSEDIMILSRNNNDILLYLDKEITYQNGYINYKNSSLTFLTVHKSKGLEAKYVILLNCNNDYLGFPNKIEDSPLINKLNTHEKIKFAEERRLFYVAITRCKEQVFILYDSNNPSPFIKEVKQIIKKVVKKVTYFK